MAKLIDFAAEHAEQFGFNPLQKRGFHGRWVSGGGVEKIASDHQHPHHADMLERARRAEAHAPFQRRGGPDEAGTILHGYGKAFDGKTVSKIADEFDRGKHPYDELPDSVKNHIGARAGLDKTRPMTAAERARRHADAKHAAQHNL